MISIIHRYLDASPQPTFAYERAAGIALEIALLAGCAAVTVTGWRGGLAALVVAVLRLYEYELRRASESVAKRQQEAGVVPALPEHKQAAADARTRAQAIVAWSWPGLTTFVAAAETRVVTSAIVAGVIATLVRIAWGRLVMPAWRRSRLRWRLRA